MQNQIDATAAENIMQFVEKKKGRIFVPSYFNPTPVSAYFKLSNLLKVC